MADARLWVREHHNRVWHWFGSGPLGYAACGHELIPGTPFCRTDPAEITPGERCDRCRELYDLRPTLLEQLTQLTPEQRHEIFAHWCKHCGGDKPCHCWNDE